VLSLNGVGVNLAAELVFHERVNRRELVGVRFVDPSEKAREAILLGVFARSETWEAIRAEERRGRFALAAAFLTGFVRYFLPERHLSRRYPTRQVFRTPRRLGRNRGRSVWLCDASPGGAGFVCSGRRPHVGDLWRISEMRWARVVYARRRLGFWWRVGVEEVEEPRDSSVMPEWEPNHLIAMPAGRESLWTDH
jgi:hypothetical protein